MHLHPRREQDFRLNTANPAMAGVHFMRFRCACCGKPRPIAGRKRSLMVLKAYDCADCVGERKQAA